MITHDQHAAVFRQLPIHSDMDVQDSAEQGTPDLLPLGPVTDSPCWKEAFCGVLQIEGVREGVR